MRLMSIKDGEIYDVVVPKILVLPETDDDATVERRYPSSDRVQLQRWAFLNGYLLPQGATND
jgi:hypothetical protein